jgi:shikimate kinase
MNMPQKRSPHNPESPDSIFLIGLMGSGKTFWSKQLSKVFNIPAFDLDTEIEKSEGKTIAEIFSEKGEEYFRQKENNVLKSLANKKDFILSAGGGAPCFYDNIDWMNANGITIWIDEPITTIVSRLIKAKSHRPLIANVPDDKLEDFFIQMRNKRLPFYSKAKFKLTGENINTASFLKIISPHE